MIEAAFLEDLDSEDIMKIIDEKLTSNVALSNEELMKLMILPLTYRKDEDRKKAIRNAIELSKRIKDPKQMVSAITGILVFSDKFIEDEYSKEISSWLNMTQVGRIINQEIQDAVEEAVTDLNKVIEEKDKQLETKDKQLESKNSLIEKLKAEVAKLGGNVAMF